MAFQKRYWVMAVGDKSFFWDECRKENFVAIGWGEYGNAKNFSNYDELKKVLIKDEIRPNMTPQKAGAIGSQIWKFGRILDEDDIVFIKRGQSRIMGIGKIKSDLYYDVNKLSYKSKKKYFGNQIAETQIAEAYPNIRDVEWFEDIPLEGIEISKQQSWLKTIAEVKEEILEVVLSELEEVGLNPIKKEPEDFNEEARAYNKVLKKKRSKAEGLRHLKLKEYVAHNPKCVGISAGIAGQMEFPFLSGDECDVVFEVSDDKAVVVEIKNGERGELVKGIYQAIKYRALMIAQKGQGKNCDVTAFLVAYNIPDNIAEFARIFDINCKIITDEMME